MEKKEYKVYGNTVTRNLSELAEPTGNIYESTMIIAKRANQIAAEVKQELSAKLEEFTDYADTLEETFENRDQIEISRHFEKMPKPTLVAIKEFQSGEIYSRKCAQWVLTVLRHTVPGICTRKRKASSISAVT